MPTSHSVSFFFDNNKFSLVSISINNDFFADALLLTGNSGVVNDDNIDATWEAWEDVPYSDETWVWSDYGANTVWYKWVAPSNGLLTLETHYYQDPEINDSVLVITSEDYVVGGVPVNHIDYDDDGGADFYSKLTNISVVSGKTYYISVAGYATIENQGWFTLTWDFV